MRLFARWRRACARRRVSVGLAMAALVACSGCSSSAEYAATSSVAREESYGGEATAYAPAIDVADADGAPAAQYAQAPEPSPAAPPGGPSGGTPQTPRQATDAIDTSGPLLVYTANLGMSVYRVDEVRANVIAAIRELGGVLTVETGNQVTVRVPAARFDEALTRIQALGDVVSRHVQAQDVGEEFRDLTIRIETLEAMRRRVERLLDQAQNVQAALEVEQHLERIIMQLEQLKGRQRFLANQVMLSTITVTFQERQVEDIARGIFELPFDWIRQIGLTNLMRLR